MPLRETRKPAAASYLRRGLLALERPRPEDQDEAGRLFRKALAADPGLAAAHAGLSRSAVYLYTLGIDSSAARLEEGLEEAKRAVAGDPSGAAAHATLALALAAADRLTPARAEAAKAIDLDPGEVEGHLALCVIDRLQRALPGALASCRRAAEIAPDAPRVLTALAETLRESEDYGAAMEMFGQAVDLDHESALPLLGAGATLTMTGQASKAARAYDTVIAKHPFAAPRALQAAAAMRLSLGDWEGALELYDRVTLPDNGALPTLLTLYGRGYSLLHLDRAAEAEYFLSLLIERVPADYDGPARGREMLFRAYDDLIAWFDGRGRNDRALALQRQAAARPGAPLDLARRLSERLVAAGSGREGAEVLERAIAKTSPGEDPLAVGEAALALARLRSEGGKRAIRPGSDAGKALVAATHLIPEDAPGPAHYRLARAFALARDADRCLAALRQATLNGYLPPQAASEKDFESMRGRPEFVSLFSTPTSQR